MNEHDDIDGLAAEYVLGTLDASERASVAARRQRETSLDDAITAWERRLSPLNDAASEIAPPAATFAKISTRGWTGCISGARCIGHRSDTQSETLARNRTCSIRACRRSHSDARRLTICTKAQVEEPRRRPAERRYIRRHSWSASMLMIAS